LAVTLCAQAGLFSLLGAFFIGIIQILIYAGAIMILFLFVILSLDPEEGRGVVRSVAVRVGSSLFVGILILQLLYFLWQSSQQRKPAVLSFEVGEMDNVTTLGRDLFTKYIVPFEIGSVLLLVAVLGAVVLAHRQTKEKG
jgi:NADH-quinone oxidoreductase subunit J